MLETIEAPVEGEAGKVFSTRPEVAFGADGKTYYIKGCNTSTAFSEVAGCRLASLAGLRVPRAEVGSFNGDLYAAVETVPNVHRNIRPWLREQQRVKNRHHLFEMIALDTWLVNDDRNMGNLVGSSVGEGRIEVFLIDFEKSRTLGENPFTTAGRIDARRLWPTAELGSLLRASRPARCPQSIIERIRALSVTQIGDEVSEVAAELPFVTWHESSIELLARRSQDLDRLVDAVWATI